jgi:dinuclear metal center YbgI/SA1388 family protein
MKQDKITINNITSYLESIAPLAYQESYDNSGLITGNPDTVVEGILICLDSIEEIIDEAIRENCNLVIAHHPIVFSGLKKFNGKNYVERTLIKAIKNDIAIYAIHTNLDNVSTGVNKMIADKLGLINQKVLSPKSGLLRKLVTFCPVAHAEKVRAAIFSADAGNIGNYSECSFNMSGEGTFRGNENTSPFVGDVGIRHTENEVRIETIFNSHNQLQIINALLKSHPYEEVAYDIYSLENLNSNAGSGIIGEISDNQSEMTFLKLVKRQLKTEIIRHTAFLGKDVKRVAVCGGSGSFLLNQAIKSGADVLITADFKYHQFFDADKKILVADIGHYESEQFTIELIKTLILEKFSTFAVRLTKVNTNPVSYL